MTKLGPTSTVHATPFFETPVRHFLVRAFHSTGIDGLLCIYGIEAALGLQSDYGAKAPAVPRKGRKVTDIMVERVGRLLGEPGDGAEFQKPVSEVPMSTMGNDAHLSMDRFRAHRLARRIGSRRNRCPG